ncbi:unnamed protein product [Heligmosomoides polygyrus]|uniref:DUF4139 domain-containing protein n=1 Tax=Heligmosomoides polygyrus TaxID=6339 RepID=A0A183GN30_HELPZ|nr:unnamed protein product [Heligmosomoides polygyrus]
MDEVAEIRSRFEAKQKQVYSLKDRVSVLQKRIEALDKVVENVGSNVVCSTKDSREPFILSNATLENLTNFYNFYDVSSTSVRSQLNDVTKSLEKNERELDALHRELHGAESHLFQQQFSRSIVITLESEKGGPVELDVFYQVDGATWRPRYELRVDTAGQRSLKVLSTAQPLLGGEIPKLGVLEAVFFNCPRTPVARHCFRGNNRAEPRSVTFGDVQEVQLDAPPMPMKPSMPSVGRPVENGLSAEFVIAKPAVISSFGAEQKVTIGVIDLIPQLFYECVPSKNTGAFLIASAVNSSSLPILPGDAAVYVDNNFVAKVCLFYSSGVFAAVSNEEHLGVAKLVLPHHGSVPRGWYAWPCF